MYGSHFLNVMNRITGSCTDFIQDVYDGKAYKNFLNKLPAEHLRNYLSAILNTDGAQKFKSSKNSVWPILLQLNELPAQARLKNIVICGLWYGKHQPNMSIFLNCFVDFFKNLQLTGIPCKINNVVRHVPLYIIQCCVDSSARCKIQGIQQWSGYHSCNWCLQKGLRDTKYVRFPFKKNLILRDVKKTIETMLAYVTASGRTAKLFRKRITLLTGIKNLCPLVIIPEFDIIWGFTVDYLHCVLLGVAKSLVEIYLSKLSPAQIAELDTIMLNFRPPHQVGRLTRPISQRCHYKAREWENFILYYSYPVLSSFLNKTKFQHWLLFSNSIYILLQDKISYSDLQFAKESLVTFVKEYNKLYTTAKMKFNVHLLLHLVQSVENFGPLWSQSTFSFESANHIILKAIHSANGVTHQIVRFVNIKHCSHILRANLKTHVSHLLQEYYDDFFNGNRVSSAIKNNEFTYFHGGDYNRDAFELVDSSTLPNKYSLYTKIVKDSCLYSVSIKEMRSDNSFAKLVDGTFVHVIAFLIDEDNKELDRTVCQLLTVADLPDNKRSAMKQVLSFGPPETVFTKQIEKICVFSENDGVKLICPVPHLLHF